MANFSADEYFLDIGYSFILIGFWLERLHCITMQNSHLFTLSVIKFDTNILNKNASIKPLARG